MYAFFIVTPVTLIFRSTLVKALVNDPDLYSLHLQVIVEAFLCHVAVRLGGRVEDAAEAGKVL